MNIQTLRSPALAMKPRWAESELMQIAFITDDMQASLDYWCGVMGAGPFFGERLVVDGTYMGKPSRFDITALIGYWGDLQVELLTQHNDEPSIYRDWDGGPFLLHHVCILTSDIEATRAKVAADGGEVVQTINMPGGGDIYARLGHGPYLQAAQIPEGVRALSDVMRQAARDWDGVTDPVRPISFVSEYQRQV